MKSCFGYVRVSTLKQGEGVSLVAQKEAIVSFAARNDITVSKWFEEKETAAKRGRPVFESLIKALRSGGADGVVIHKIDRSARNFGDWAKIGELSDIGIDVHFASESLDFRSRGGRLTADIQAVIAADFIRNLREETKKGINGRLKQGLYPFRSPIGYVDNGSGKVKTPDPVQAPLVTQAFELYASGRHSLRTLRLEMDRQGLRNYRNKPLSKRGIETMLGNPFYCGVVRIKQTGEVFRGAHEPIISATQFETVQEVRSGKCGKKVTRHNHTYRGLFRCQLCQAAMTPELQKGHVYYRCQTSKCVTKSIREEGLEAAVSEMLARVRLSDADQTRLVNGIEEWCEKKAQATTSSTASMQLAQLSGRLDRLTDAVIDRLIDQDTFHQRKEKLLLEEAKLKETVEAERKIRLEPNRLQKFLELIKNLSQNYELATKLEKREIVKLATSNRFVAGRNIYLEGSYWLKAVENALAVSFGAPYRPTSRRRTELREEQLDELAELIKSEEVASFEVVFSKQPENSTISE